MCARRLTIRIRDSIGHENSARSDFVSPDFTGLHRWSDESTNQISSLSRFPCDPVSLYESDISGFSSCSPFEARRLLHSMHEMNYPPEIDTLGRAALMPPVRCGPKNGRVEPAK